MYVGARVARHIASARSVAIVSASTGRLSAKWDRSPRAASVSIVVQHSIVARSSQWSSVMPPASPAAFITRANSGTLASKVCRHMNIFMLGCPPRTARGTSSTTAGVGVMTIV